MNQYKAPRDKLVCVLNCCRVINNLLAAAATAATAPPGADDFLPVLVLVLLRAAPPQLASNLAYIGRFRLASRLVSETAYFYTNLVSAAVRVDAAACVIPQQCARVALACVLTQRCVPLLPHQCCRHSWRAQRRRSSRAWTRRSLLRACARRCVAWRRLPATPQG